LPLTEIRAQLGRGSIEPETPGVPEGMTKQIVRFAAIGSLSTLAYLMLFLVCHPFMGAQPANFLALALTAIANTAANRRFTFGVRERAGAARHQLQGFGVFLLGLAITSGSLALLQATAPAAGRLLELTVLVTANLVATLLRFLLMRRWIFRRSVVPAR
jgi:putative flippase GtrA